MKLWWHGDRSIIDLKSHGISWLYSWSSRSHLAEGSFTSTQKKIFSWFIRWINRPNKNFFFGGAKLQLHRFCMEIFFWAAKDFCMTAVGLTVVNGFSNGKSVS